MDWLKQVHGASTSGKEALVRSGDDVRVWYKIREQDRERLTPFEGVVIRTRGSRFSKTFTVRRITYGEGVERVFPVDAPLIERVEILRRGKTKRSRLYFLRHMLKRVRLETASEQNVPSPMGTPTSEPLGQPSEMMTAKGPVDGVESPAT